MCARQVTGASVSVSSRLATCVGCHTVFDITDQLARSQQGKKSGELAPLVSASDQPSDQPSGQPSGDPSPVAVRSAPELPHGFRIELRPAPAPDGGAPYRSAGRTRDDLTVEWPWYHRKHWFTIGFTLLWYLFLAIWYIRAGLYGDFPMMVFLSVHVIVAMVLGYVSLALVINRTTIAIRDEALELSHGPVPWPGERRIPIRELAQLYCKEEVAYYKNQEPVMVYALYARRRLKGRQPYLRPLHAGAGVNTGDDVKLTNRLTSPEQALYLEQQLEDCLGITDVPIPGAIPRTS